MTSRLTVLTIMFFFFAGVLVYRCFNLQIINGEEYLNDFILQIEKTRDITSTRGRILDRNGNVLAENELAYSVKIEDVFESSRNKNAEVNDVVYRLIKLIEKNGDSVITDFKIVIDEDGDYVYSVNGTALLRFQADVLGYKTVDKLSEEEKAMTAQELMEYLSRAKGFAIGQYEDPEDRTSPFIVGKGYTKEEWLQMVTIRYAMNLTSFRKYVGTTVATNVSEKTVAVIMENSDQLDGVSIVEDTVRHYIDSKYFAHILGYTGKISSDELTDLNEQVVAEGGSEDAYTINDVVGKSGIESYMETTLQGTKGSEKVVVDNTGKVITILERKEAQPGADVYLTIDKDLTEAVYNIVEQKLAGLVSSKIINAKEFNLPENAKSSSIKIPIYDVYFTMINNNILDRKHFEAEDAGETERAVYAAYLEYKQGVYDKLNYELTEGGTPYNKLSKEYQVYQSNIVSLLRDDGVIMKELVDDNDATQIAWAKDEVISLKEYLQYCIAMNWIDVSRLDLNEKYSDSAEVYNKLLEYIIETIDHTTEFQKRFYKYMLLNDKITGRQICMLLCEQRVVDIPAEDEEALYAGKMSAYQFMMNRITNLEITPAQLALDPCNASVVITDVNTGDVLAMVSYPGYDNNKMANTVDAEYYARLNADKSSPQLNFATQYKAAPGSTFKIVSATAGLMENVINLQTKVNCVGTFTEITPSPRCWKISGHGYENVTSAIKDSCNYFFYNVGYQLATSSGSYNEEAGLETLSKYADLYGLTGRDPLTIPLDGQDVMSLFQNTDALGITPEQIGGTKLGALGIPEFGTDFAMQMVIDAKPKAFSDLVRISGLSHGTNVWLGNAQDLIMSGVATISTAICTRDDIMLYLIQMGVESEKSFKIMEAVRKGMVAKGKCAMWEEWKADMLAHDVPQWYIESCQKIEYMFPKAHAAAYVMMAWRIAYCKIHYPLAYYGAFFSIRAKAFSYEIMCQGQRHLESVMAEYKKRQDTLSNKEKDAMGDMRIVQEMYARGFEFEPIDIFRAQSRSFQIVDGKLMPSLNSIDGLGEKAADAIVEAAKDGPFLSKDDFRQRTKVSKTIIDLMDSLGLLGDLPESNQISIFDLV